MTIMHGWSMALKGPVSPRDKPELGPWTPVKYTFAGKPVKTRRKRKPGKRSRKRKRKQAKPRPESVVDQLALLAIGEQ